MAPSISWPATPWPLSLIHISTGAAAVINSALAALKVHGVLVVTGIHAAPVPIDLTAMVRKHQQIRASYRAPERNWPLVVDYMRSHQDTLRHMITHREMCIRDSY